MIQQEERERTVTIDPARLQAILKDCLFKNEEIIDGKPPADAILLQGVTLNIGFHAKRVESHKTEIEAFLAELPTEIKDGISFLVMCQDKEGQLWTGSHRSVEELLLLGLAIKRLQYCLPKEMWYMLPEKLPYVQLVS